MGATFLTSDERPRTLRRRWNDDERQMLRDHYSDLSTATEEIAARLDRTAAAVGIEARRLGLTRPIKRSPQGDLSRLLEESPQAAYWLGFILADGHFTEKRMTVTLKASDRDHLDRLRGWLGPDFHPPRLNRHGQYTLACQDRINVPEIRRRFGIVSAKTYSPPPSLPYQDVTLLKSLLVGFIDGDGAIHRQTGRPAAAVATVSHIAWKPFIEALSVGAGFGYVKVRPCGRYVGIHSARHNEICDLKRFAIAAELPVLERKWDRVDLSYVPRDGSVSRQVSEALASGMRQRDVVRLVGCSSGLVSRINQRMNEAN